MRKIYNAVMPYLLFIIIGIGLGLFATGLCYVTGAGLCQLIGIQSDEALIVLAVDIGFISTMLFFVVESN
jgi:hypothetical protein